MHRIRPRLQTLAWKCSAWVSVSQYGMMHLSHLSQRKETTMLKSTEFLSTLCLVVESLYRMKESDVLFGMKVWLRERQSFDFNSSLEKCVDAMFHMSMGHYEVASKYLNYVLLSDEKQHFEERFVRFLGNRLIECAFRLNDKSKLEHAWNTIRDMKCESLCELEKSLEILISQSKHENLLRLSTWRKFEMARQQEDDTISFEIKSQNISVLGVSNVIESLGEEIDTFVHCDVRSSILTRNQDNVFARLRLARKRLNFDLARSMLKSARDEIGEAYDLENTVLEYEASPESRLLIMSKLWDRITSDGISKQCIHTSLVRCFLKLAKWLKIYEKSLNDREEIAKFRQEHGNMNVESCLRYAESYCMKNESTSFSLRSKVYMRLAHWHFDRITNCHEDESRHALNFYSRALQIGQCRVDDEILAMLRVMKLLSVNHDLKKKEESEQQDLLNLVPVQPWLRIVPQLFARLRDSASRSHFLNKSIRSLVSRICTYAPHRVVYNLSAARAVENEENGNDVNSMYALSPSLSLSLCVSNHSTHSILTH